MKLKRALTVFLSIAIMLSALPFTAYAGLVDEDKGKAKLTMVLLKESDTEDIGFEAASQSDVGTAKGSEFYIGIKMNNFKNLQEVQDYVWKSNTSPDNKQGLNGISVGIAYNTDYVAIEAPTTDDSLYDEGELMPDAIAEVWTNRATTNDFLIKKTATAHKYSYQSASISEDDCTVQSDINKHYTKEMAVSIMNADTNTPRNVPYSGGDEDTYFAIIKFVVTNAMTGVSNGTRIVGFSANKAYSNMSFGINTAKITYQDDGNGKTSGSTQDFSLAVEKDDSELDFFPAGAPTLVSIAKSGDFTKALTDYVEGDKFNPANIKITPTLDTDGTQAPGDEIAPIASNYKGLKFYAEDAADLVDTDQDPKNLTKEKEITKDTALTVTDHNNKHIYVYYELGDVKKAVYLGQLKVKANTIKSIDKKTTDTTIDTTKGADGQERTFYSTGIIRDFLKGGDEAKEKLTVTLTYENDASVDVKYDAFTTNGLDLYWKGANDDKLVRVKDTDTFTAPTTVLYVVEKTKAEEGKTVTETKPKATITINNIVAESNILKDVTLGVKELHYAPNATINFDDAVIGYNKNTDAVDAAKRTAKVSDNGAPGIIFYTGDSADPAENKYNSSATDKVISNKVTQYVNSGANSLKDKHVFAVLAGSDDNTTPVYVGQLGDRVVSTASGDVKTGYTVTGITTDANTEYGAKLGDNVSITVTYDNGDTETITGAANIKAAGITMKIYAKDAEDSATPLVADANKDTILTPAMNGGTVRFFVTEDDGNGGTKDTKIGTSATLSVKKKTINVSLDNVNGSITKPYDGKTALKEDVKAADVVITSDDLVTDEDKTAAASLAITGVDFNYDSAAAGDNTKKIEVSGTPVFASDSALNNLYTLVIAEGDTIKKTGDKFTVKKDASTELTATIEKKQITLKEITEVPAIKVNADSGLKGTKTITLGTANTDDLVKVNDVLDNVTLTYEYDYSDSSVTDITKEGTPTIKVTIDGTASDGTTTLGLGGAAVANYVLKSTTAPETKGTVELKTLKTITIKTEPKSVTDQQTYPNIYFDPTGLEINMNYEGDSTTVYDLDTFLNKGGIIKIGNNTITKSNPNEKIALVPGVETKVEFSIDQKPAETKVTVKQIPIKLSDIIFKPSKTHGKEGITPDFEFKNGIDILPADLEKIKVNYTAKFTDDDVAYENGQVIKKSGTEISKIKFDATGDGVNEYTGYVIIDDTTNQPVTDATTITTSEGTITQAEQTKVPDKPVVSVDPATNHIKIESPVGEDIEYSVDGTNFYSQEEFEKTDRDFAKTYSVVARTKQSDDNNTAPSAASAATDVKTLSYRIDVYRKGATEVTASGYTDKTSVKDATEIHDIIGGKPGSFKAYYTDADTTAEVTYDFSITGNAKANVVTLYYTRSAGSSGGGGGGSTAYKVKFDAADNGVISSGKTTVSVEKGKTVTEDSVPVVTPKTGYTFVGWSTDGTTIVNPTTEAVTKAVTYTAVYEEIAVPTQAPAPTQAPVVVIDENYTKPYASGYEDGTFRPNGNITRAELAAMIARLSFGDDIPDGAYTSSFSDVEDDAWFAKYVGYLEDKDVLSGYEDGTFRPFNPVTRGEISAVLSRAQRFGLDTYTGQFADVTDYDWAKDYIQTLADRGIASGYEDGTFGPYNPLTRAEAVTMINKVLAASEPVITFTPNDIAGHWAETEILLASNERRLLDSSAEAPVEEPAEEPETTVEEPANDAEAVVEESTEAEAETEIPAEATTEAEAEAETPAE